MIAHFNYTLQYCYIFGKHRYFCILYYYNYFEIFSGVMQGDTLAPFLFVIVLDYAMR